MPTDNRFRDYQPNQLLLLTPDMRERLPEDHLAHFERHTYDSVPFRVLAAGAHPVHDTIAEFRRRHLAALAGLFVAVLRLCRQTGLVKLGHVALDGTKVRDGEGTSYLCEAESDCRVGGAVFGRQIAHTRYCPS